MEIDQKLQYAEDWEYIGALSVLLDVDQKELDRFIRKIRIDPETDCWLWVAALNFSGYGSFTRSTGPRRGISDPAHRIAHEWYIGPIPEGFQVHHKCDVRNCVNPRHLEALSIADHVSKTTGHPVNQSHCFRGHEYTPENTRIYRGARACRACIAFLARVRRGTDKQSDTTSLYCINGHPLFGENMTLIEVRGGYRRYCKECRRDAADRYRQQNQEVVLLAKTMRRADLIAARKLNARQQLISLRQTVHLIPDRTLVDLVRRLVNGLR